MKQTNDIRWIQRFKNFSDALSQLDEFVTKGDALNTLEETGMIKAFEFTYELAWNTMKDFYELQGEAGLQGSRDTIQLAFKRGLITDGAGWMAMLKDRNRSAHTYNRELAEEIAQSILITYHPRFHELATSLHSLSREHTFSIGESE